MSSIQSKRCSETTFPLNTFRSYPMYDSLGANAEYPDFEQKDVTFLSFVLTPNLATEGVVAPNEPLINDAETKGAIAKLKSCRNELAHRGMRNPSPCCTTSNLVAVKVSHV